ncbi:hypothetical protein AB3N59_14830 [Leptospira sp. WS92.C1]
MRVTLVFDLSAREQAIRRYDPQQIVANIFMFNLRILRLSILKVVNYLFYYIQILFYEIDQPKRNIFKNKNTHFSKKESSKMKTIRADNQVTKIKRKEFTKTDFKIQFRIFRNKKEGDICFVEPIPIV